jgi:hypothetical protein
MRRAKVFALTATVMLLAGTATAAAQGGGTQPKAAPGAESVAPLAAFNQYTSAPVSIAPGTSSSASVSCPAGQVPSGGGAGTSAFDVYLLDTRPAGSGWLVFGRNTGTTTQSITAYVVCTTP